MKRALVAALLATTSLYAQDAPRVTAASPAGGGPERLDPWFGTFSIIAFDPATGTCTLNIEGCIN